MCYCLGLVPFKVFIELCVLLRKGYLFILWVCAAHLCSLDTPTIISVKVNVYIYMQGAT